MSYKTNTIANRLKITKGWKSSLFPTKKWDYSRETVLWFKLYFFLKAYLACKKIQLLSCEVRISERNTYLLYLAVNKTKRKKKRYIRTALLLKKFKSAFNRQKAKKAKHLLYSADLALLKQISFWKYNNTRQKKLTPLWIAKPKLFSWINLRHIVKTQRQRYTIYQKIKQNKKISRANAWRAFQFWGSKRQSEKKYWDFFFTLKKKKLINIFVRLRKNTLLLQKYLFFLPNNNKNYEATVFFLNKQIKKQISLAKQIYELYFFLEKEKEANIPVESVSWQEEKNLLLKKQTKQKWKRLWGGEKKQVNFFVIKSFLQSLERNPNEKLFFLQSLIHPKTFSYGFFLPLKNYFWKFFAMSSFLSWKTKRDDFLTQFFIKKIFSKKISNFQKRISRSILEERLLPQELFISQGLRFQQKLMPKKRLLRKKKSFFWKRVCLPVKLLQKRDKNKAVPFKGKRNTILLRKKTWRILKAPSKKKVFFNYRLPYRRAYIQTLKFSVNYNLKHWLRQVIYKYFAVNFCIKFLWPLNQFKNIKFYRLAFSAKKERRKQKARWKKEKNSVLKRYPRASAWQNYIYLARTHLPFTPTSGEREQEKNLTKKRPYFLKKWARIENKRKLRIKPLTNAFFMKNLVPTLSLFTKYLDPQLLADNIAKVIERAKKQSWFLYDLRQILRSLFLKNIAGYKIVLIGRINGRKKTGLMSIQNAKESNSQQTWLKQVSFGAAQARGRIGTFGIKIWVYH